MESARSAEKLLSKFSNSIKILQYYGNCDNPDAYNIVYTKYMGKQAELTFYGKASIKRDFYSQELSIKTGNWDINETTTKILNEVKFSEITDEIQDDEFYSKIRKDFSLAKSQYVTLHCKDLFNWDQWRGVINFILKLTEDPKTQMKKKHNQ